MEASIDDPLPGILVSILAISPTFLIFSALILIVLLSLSALVSGSEVAFFSLTTMILTNAEAQIASKIEGLFTY